MAYEQKNLTGSCFKNDRRTTDKHPNYTGSALIDGTSYFIDCWINVDKNGDRYMSLKFKEKDKQPQQAPRRQERSYAEASGAPPLDDEIPFAPEWR